MGKQKDPALEKRIEEISDGKLTSREIAEMLGCTPRYVRGIQERKGLPRSKKAPPGELSKNWRGGRKVDRDGYVLVTAPLGHPYCRNPGKKRLRGLILEHRLVMEQKLGRYLLPHEVVDHIDGNRLNNDPKNLRLFQSNGEHLSHTLKGKCPQWSREGKEKLLSRIYKRGKFVNPNPEQIDTYNQRKKLGEIRMQQILRARDELGKDHPQFSGMERYLESSQTIHPDAAKDISSDE